MFGGQEIQGKTIGVIGLGAIGSRVVSAALGLGMKVIGYDPVLSLEALQLRDRMKRVTELMSCSQRLITSPFTCPTLKVSRITLLTLTL